MKNFTVNGVEYSLEFDHKTKLGKRHRLPRNAPIKAITTCIVTCYGAATNEPRLKRTHKFTAVESAICGNEDHFSRPKGCLLALRKALDHCGVFRAPRMFVIAAALEAEWQAMYDRANAPQIRIPRPKLSEVEREQFRNLGAGKRLERSRARLELAKKDPRLRGEGIEGTGTGAALLG